MLISEKLILLFGNFFGQKVRCFRSGQKRVFLDLSTCVDPEKAKIWFHVSSLGEYEQALPVLEKIKEKHPDYQIILSFFSPSGYEVKKEKTPADCVVYLPVDTKSNAKKFLHLVQPEKVFFVKYDFWPNYLFELKQRSIPTYLIAGLFTKEHKFFKPYNSWLKNALTAFSHFFVQDDNSKQVLLHQGFKNVTVTGDTRFDRVSSIANQVKNLHFVEKFKQDSLLLVAGSTWPKDEALLLPFVNHEKSGLKTIFVPHQVDDHHIKQLIAQLKKKHILFTDIQDDTDLSQFDVLIINTIGLLNRIYKYADIVYIGNGFGKSIHNIQEPAVYGVPIITGPNIQKFKEAVDLEKTGGLITIQNQNDLNKHLKMLIDNEKLRQKKAEITKKYAQKNVGATDKIMQLLQDEL
jgi:3-deoxy-D-manno-octulosonic-acid transferase